MKLTTLSPIEVSFTANAPVLLIDSLALSAEKQYGDAMVGACNISRKKTKTGRGFKQCLSERTPR